MDAIFVSGHIKAGDEPTIKLQDVFIFVYESHEEKVGNLLTTQVDGVMTVNGKLSMDMDDENLSLIRPQFQKDVLKPSGTQISFNTTLFSIGWDGKSYQLWAWGSRKWFEILPSKSYLPVYKSNLEAIAAYYIMLFIHEDDPGCSLAGALLKYGLAEGGGLNRGGVIVRLKSHATFLLSQMRKGESSDVHWQRTEFFHWLASECIGVYKSIVKNTPSETFIPPRKIILEDAPDLPQVFTPREVLEERRKHSRRYIYIQSTEQSLERSQSPGLKARQDQSFQYRKETQFTALRVPPAQDSVVIADAPQPAAGETLAQTIARLVHLGATQNQKDKFSMKTVANWLNRTYAFKFSAQSLRAQDVYKLSDHMTSVEAVFCLSSQIYLALPARYQNLPIGKELWAAANESQFQGLSKEEAKAKKSAWTDLRSPKTELHVRKGTKAAKASDLTKSVSARAALRRERKAEIHGNGHDPGTNGGSKRTAAAAGNDVTHNSPTPDAAVEPTAGKKARREFTPPEMGEEDDKSYLNPHLETRQLPEQVNNNFEQLTIVSRPLDETELEGLKQEDFIDEDEMQAILEKVRSGPPAQIRRSGLY
ncbi:hypothetical protein B0O99DRAFT_611553 [Bisporella sp. PMI_857]|nr:hypothetical protein B0O99DRAFT_611553 [Bisporella sp. PMI_857]